jgi:2-haloacid dehalogenase
MQYKLFLFDLDDTLLDFSASEVLSFIHTTDSLGINLSHEVLFQTYKTENRALWALFEEGKTTKDHLKVERFRRTFSALGVEADPEAASQRYLEALPETVVLMDHAEEICQWASERGEIGIITNGIHATQIRRIEKSPLGQYISFISVSEDCGFAKPDTRFFEYSIKMAKGFSKDSTLVIGDRLETDILGAKRFGVDSVWFNRHCLASADPNAKPQATPTHEIRHLEELKRLFFKGGTEQHRRK